MNLKEIETYIHDLQNDELNFKNQSSINGSDENKRRDLSGILCLAKHIVLSIIDFTMLFYIVRFKRNKIIDKKIVFTAKNFCTEKNGVLEDRIVKPLFTEDILFINQSKEIRLRKVNKQKVYNLGGLVKLISYFFYRKQSKLMRIFSSYRLINDVFIRHLNGSELYMLWFYDINSLALVFSKHRSNIRLIEVQHGSMINYPPYAKPAPIKIADLFYIKNQSTIEYLKLHLCALHPSEYKLIPYPHSDREYLPGLHIFYASTVEFNGLHPVFKDFLLKNRNKDLHVIVRLHPREREKEPMFAKELSGYNINYEFDHSKNWLEGKKIKNMIIISPWSSSLEDAFDNGFTTITIDLVGKERFRHLIDDVNFFYSDDLTSTIEVISQMRVV